MPHASHHRPQVPHWSAGGPGTELHALLAELGVTPRVGCACRRRMEEMDQRGVRWVREHASEVAGWLREEQRRRGWAERLTAAARAVVSGLAFRLDPGDPAPGLVAEAVRRAEAKAGGAG
jgi:hypothetical protein